MLNSLRLSLCLIAAFVIAPGALAQSDSNLNEFTQQGLLIANLPVKDGADAKLGRRTAELIRSVVSRATNKREAEVIDERDIDLLLKRAELSQDAPFTLQDIRHAGRFFRVDEFLWANVAATGSGFMIQGDLVLMRDERIRQPLPLAMAPTLEAAATKFANGIVAARRQLAPARRCENAMRDNEGARAVTASQEGIKIYPRATIARTCLVRSLRFTRSPASDILRTAEEILAMDGQNTHAMEAAAFALDALNRTDEAADAWLRLAASDTANTDLALQVASALLYGGNSKRATQYINGRVAANPANMPLQQVKWQIAFNNKDWKSYTEAAEVLHVGDSTSARSPQFYQQLGVAYAEMQQPVRSIQVLAQGVLAFPNDARLYALYTQYLRAEADTAIRRGLQKFPTSPELIALNARDLRSRGKFEESLSAMKLAVSTDSTMAQAHLMMAQLEIQMARPDSALAALRKGLKSGEDTTAVAQFALGEGNILYRAASTAKTRESYETALRMLTYADSLQRTPQSQFLIGAAALGVAQSVLTDAGVAVEKRDVCLKTEDGMRLVVLARAGFEGGRSLYSDQAKASVEFLDKLEQYAQETLRPRCQPFQYHH